MSHARQSRRIAKQWAAFLGELDGAEAADDFASNLDEKTRTGELEYFSKDPSFVWDEPARNANSHRFARCPKGFEAHYYAAYEYAARERVLELIRIGN